MIEKNKRKHPRIDCLVPVDGKDGTAFACSRTIDISHDGVGFISNRAVPLKERIAVELVVSSNSEPVLVVGEVRWVRKISNKEQYRIGLQFSDVIDGSLDGFDASFGNNPAACGVGDDI